MNWMKLVTAIVAINLVLAWMPGAVRAGDDPAIAIPTVTYSPENPYAKLLPEAQTAASDALAKLNTVIQQDPFNFDAQIQAYYTYATAQARWDALRQLADDWERQSRGSFTGKVLSFDTEVLIPRLDDTAATPEPSTTSDAAERHLDPSIMRLALPVAGARITLRSMRMWIMNRPSKAPAGTGGLEPRPMIYPPPPGIGRVYNATTIKDGSFKFEGQIPPDNYSMVVSKEGFESWHGSVEIPKTGNVERTVYLSRFKVLLGTVQTVLLALKPRIDPEQRTLSATGVARTSMMPPQRGPTIPVAGALVSLTPEPILFRPMAQEGNPVTTSVTATVAGTATANVSVRAFPVKGYSTKTGPKGDYRIQGVRTGRYHLHVEKDGLRPFDGTLYVKGIWQHQNVVLLPAFPPIGPMPPPRPPVLRLEKQLDTPTGGNLDKPFDNK